MPFNFSVDNDTWTEADLAGDLYALGMWPFLHDLMSINFNKNIALCISPAISTGSVALTLSRRSVVAGSGFADTAFPVGTPVIIGRENIVKNEKPLLRYGTVTAVTPTVLTINITSTNGVTDASSGTNKYWFITPWMLSFDLTGTLGFPGGTGQTTAAAARTALKVHRPSTGMEVVEDFVGYSGVVTAASASQAYLNRFFAACGGGGEVYVNGYAKGYDYPFPGRHPGVALLRAPSVSDAASISLASAAQIHIAQATNFKFEACFYLPDIKDCDSVLSIGLFCTNGGGSLRTFMASSTPVGQGIISAFSVKDLLNKTYPIHAIDMTGVTSARVDPVYKKAGWARLSFIVSVPTAVNPQWEVNDDSNNMYYTSSFLTGINTTSANNWVTPFAKLTKLGGSDPAWALVDYLSVKAEGTR